MYINLRLICENLSRIAVKLIFLWGCEHGVYATASFAANVTSWFLRNSMHSFPPVIFYVNVICIAQWLTGANIEILHYCSAFPRHILFKPYNNFKQTGLNFFTTKIWSHFSITSQLRLGPFLHDAAQIMTCCLESVPLVISRSLCSTYL